MLMIFIGFYSLSVVFSEGACFSLTLTHGNISTSTDPVASEAPPVLNHTPVGKLKILISVF